MINMTSMVVVLTDWGGTAAAVQWWGWG